MTLTIVWHWRTYVCVQVDSRSAHALTLIGDNKKLLEQVRARAGWDRIAS